MENNFKIVRGAKGTFNIYSEFHEGTVMEGILTRDKAKVYLKEFRKD